MNTIITTATAVFFFASAAYAADQQEPIAAPSTMSPTEFQAKQHSRLLASCQYMLNNTEMQKNVSKDFIAKCQATLSGQPMPVTATPVAPANGR